MHPRDLLRPRTRPEPPTKNPQTSSVTRRLNIPRINPWLIALFLFTGAAFLFGWTAGSTPVLRVWFAIAAGWGGLWAAAGAVCWQLRHNGTPARGGGEQTAVAGGSGTREAVPDDRPDMRQTS